MMMMMWSWDKKCIFLSFFLSDVQGLPGDFGKPGHPGEPGLPVSIWIMNSSWYSVYTRRCSWTVWWLSKRQIFGCSDCPASGPLHILFSTHDAHGAKYSYTRSLEEGISARECQNFVRLKPEEAKIQQLFAPIAAVLTL